MGTSAKRSLLILMVASLCGACSSSTPKSDGAVDASPDGDGSGNLTGRLVQSRKLDILFVVEDATIASAQQKFISQMPVFTQALQALPGGLPDLHVAVISADMGIATGGSTNLGCRTTGDDGIFENSPQGTCVDSTLTAGATFVTDDATGAGKDFTVRQDSDGQPQCTVTEHSGGVGRHDHRLPLAERRAQTFSSCRPNRRRAAAPPGPAAERHPADR